MQPRGLLAAPGCHRMSQPIQRVSTCCFVSGSVRRQGSQEVTNHSERRRAVQADSQVAQWRKDRWLRKGSAVSKTPRSAARVTFAWSDNSGPYPRRGAARAPATVRARRAGSAKTDSTNSLSSATSMPGGKHESCQKWLLKNQVLGEATNTALLGAGFAPAYSHCPAARVFAEPEHHGRSTIELWTMFSIKEHTNSS